MNDDWKNFEPRKNVPVAATQAKDAVVVDIDAMSIQELKTLVRRLLCQCGAVAVMTKEETAQAMRDVLAETALRPIIAGANIRADIQSRMVAIDKWLDRTEGKPVGTSANINIGAGAGEKQIRVIFVTPEDVRKEKKEKIIEG